jgi:hypothetical protein
MKKLLSRVLAVSVGIAAVAVSGWVVWRRRHDASPDSHQPAFS